MLLDDQARILSVNIGLAGSSFLGLAEKKQSKLHKQLHPACNGKCRFKKLWRTAWRELASNDSAEWEIDDPVLGKLLRLNLARPPSTQVVEHDRRRGYALLTITDITRHRREYESLVKRERTLQKLLQEQGLDPTVFQKSDAEDRDLAQAVGGGQSSPELGREAILAQDDERRRLAKELHDSIAQSAGVIKYNIETAITKLSLQDPTINLAGFENVVEQIRELVEEIRRVSNNLAPSMLEDFGLCAALRGLCSDFRSESCNVIPDCDTCIDESQMPDIIRFTIYRVAQEALNNIARHSSATRAGVDLRVDNEGLRLLIEDNGDGFDLGGSSNVDADRPTGAGLRNMRDRVVVSGGEFSIKSAPGQGVAIQATWPASSLATTG